jgi:hypothetical protein
MLSSSRLAAAAALVFLAHTPGAMAGTWRAVPGAPDVAIDLGSFRQERTRVLVWVRWWGKPSLASESAAAGRTPRIQRTALQTEFDCGRRTMQVMAAQGYDSGGAVVFMSSARGAVLPVQGDEMTWTYDAVCEATRAGGRL